VRDAPDIDSVNSMCRNVCAHNCKQRPHAFINDLRELLTPLSHLFFCAGGDLHARNKRGSFSLLHVGIVLLICGGEEVHMLNERGSFSLIYGGRVLLFGGGLDVHTRNQSGSLF
jgi:hypothetical protein